jgi:hypothetical protein
MELDDDAVVAAAAAAVGAVELFEFVERGSEDGGTETNPPNSSEVSRV